ASSASIRSSGWSTTSRGAPGRPDMRFGYWMPVFGGWLRNVGDESMDASFAYNKRLARRSEAIGFDMTLIAELFLNDIKGIAAPRRVAPRRRARRGHRVARAHGRGAPDVPLAGDLRQAGGEPRPDLERPARAQRGVFVVVRRGAALRRALREARRPLRPHRRV